MSAETPKPGPTRLERLASLRLSSQPATPEEMALAEELFDLGYDAQDLRHTGVVWFRDLAANQQRAWFAIARHVLKSRQQLDWHYLPELPDAETTCLIALEREDTDEVLLGYYADGVWWQSPADVDLFIASPVRAWAYAPAAAPAKKQGGAK